MCIVVVAPRTVAIGDLFASVGGTVFPAVIPRFGLAFSPSRLDGSGSSPRPSVLLGGLEAVINRVEHTTEPHTAAVAEYEQATNRALVKNPE